MLLPGSLMDSSMRDMGQSGELGKPKTPEIEGWIAIYVIILFCRAMKVKVAHPGLETVTTCHNYEIQYKHNYKCVLCGYRYV